MIITIGTTKTTLIRRMRVKAIKTMLTCDETTKMTDIKTNSNNCKMNNYKQNITKITRKIKTTIKTTTTHIKNYNRCNEAYLIQADHS